MAEPFEVPELKDQVGWRLLEQDKKDLRILMASYKEKSPTALLRMLVQRDAATARSRWREAAKRIADAEDPTQT